MSWDDEDDRNDQSDAEKERDDARDDHDNQDEDHGGLTPFFEDEDNFLWFT